MFSIEIEKGICDLFVRGEYVYPSKNKEYSIKYNYVRAIFSNFVKNHIMRRHRHIKEKLSIIIKEYKQNVPILKLSKKYDFPPYLLAKMIERALNIKLDKTPLESFDKFTTPHVMRQQLKRSQHFEEVLENVLRRSNISFVTQNQLIQEGKSLTPDFLLKKPLKINNLNIHWIDAKNMYGGNNNFTHMVIKKQHEKYTNTFGEGLFIFRYSYSDELKTQAHLMWFKEFKKLMKSS